MWRGVGSLPATAPLGAATQVARPTVTACPSRLCRDETTPQWPFGKRNGPRIELMCGPNLRQPARRGSVAVVRQRFRRLPLRLGRGQVEEVQVEVFDAFQSGNGLPAGFVRPSRSRCAVVDTQPETLTYFDTHYTGGRIALFPGAPWSSNRIFETEQLKNANGRANFFGDNLTLAVVHGIGIQECKSRRHRGGKRLKRPLRLPERAQDRSGASMPVGRWVAASREV